MTNLRKEHTVSTKNSKDLEARAEALEAAIESRMTPSERQAEFATGADRRATDDDGDREHPISATTRIQAAIATRRRS